MSGSFLPSRKRSESLNSESGHKTSRLAFQIDKHMEKLREIFKGYKDKKLRKLYKAEDSKGKGFLVKK